MKVDPNVAHIVFGSDNRFAEILGVSLLSLYENSKDMSDICVYILDGGIAFDSKDKLRSISHGYGRPEPIFIDACNIAEKLGVSVTLDRGSISQYARLFLSQLLPDSLERVLYLDCDTLIMKSIRELWSLNLQGKTIGALMDAFSPAYRANIDLLPDDIMFNSGVMLIDLVRWNEMLVENRLLDFIKIKKGQIQQGDQGVLNAVLSHDVFCFDPRFNVVTIFYDFSYDEMMIYRKPSAFYSEKTILSAIDDPTIIHFTTSFKSIRPWYTGCWHVHACNWRMYRGLSPWCNDELWRDSRPSWKVRCLSLYEKAPKKLALYGVGWLQAYGRPFKNKMGW